MNSTKILAASVLMLPAFVAAWPAAAQVLTTATYDNDSYIFLGFNGVNNPGITTTTDVSGGVPIVGGTFIAHSTFAVIKFDVSGLTTVANGGPEKHLWLDWIQDGPAEVAVSAAGADMETGYPFGGFIDDGQGEARYQWYRDNIKGDDSAYGGYAGGATHLGVIDTNTAGTYSLDVTAAVDAWIDGSVPNYGFGLWAVNSGSAQGSTLDFASSEYAGAGGFQGPRLALRTIPEPAAATLACLAAAATFGSAACQRFRATRVAGS